MWKLPALAAALFAIAFVAPSPAQTVRFETSVGDFDIVLNPTNNPNLQGLVDNFVAYVGLGRYHGTAINRAADGDPTETSDDFVLQLGSFFTSAFDPNLFVSNIVPIDSFDPVTLDTTGDNQVDFDISGLNNTRGTVTLALSNLPNTNTPNVNSGNSSFFVNVGDNSGDMANTDLDASGFVPFATVPDLTTIDAILALDQVDLGGTAFGDIPLDENGQLVTVQRAFIVDAPPWFRLFDAIAGALGFTAPGQMPGDEMMEEMMMEGGMTVGGSTGSGIGTLTPATATPEPSSLLLLSSMLGWLACRRR